MAGSNFGQSLDIGKELEKEKDEKKQPLPCVCSPDLNKKEKSPEPQPEQQEISVQQNTEKQTEPPAQEEKQEEASVSEPAAKEIAQNEEAKPAEEQKEDVPAEVTEAKRAADSAEEDVNEIITKEIPVLKQRTSIWESIFAHTWIFWIVFVVVVSGMFWAWMSVTKEVAVVGNSVLPLENSSSLLFNATYEELILPAAANISQEENASLPEAPNTSIVQKEKSPEELAKILAEGLTG
jgi:hypothetical protein